MRLGIDFGTTRTVVASADRGNYPVVTFSTGSGEGWEFYPNLLATRGRELRTGFSALEVVRDPDWRIIRSLKRHLASPLEGVKIAGWTVSELLARYLEDLRTALLTGSNLRHQAGEPLDVAIAVPANAAANQRLLTADAFRRAGLSVQRMLDEPSAAGLEYAWRRPDDARVRRRTLAIYDLGGGTFDASVIALSEDVHRVITTEGIRELGGDDFDAVLLELACARSGCSELERSAERDRLLELCREEKERFRPTTRRLMPDLLGDGTSPAIPVSDYEAALRPLVGRTVDALQRAIDRAAEREGQHLARHAVVHQVGGASQLPTVGRMLRERFGRRVWRSPYPHAAIAIGLAIAAEDTQSPRIAGRFTRHFGVWREGESGTNAVFDPVFPKDTELPRASDRPLVRTRRYRAAHNIAHFRFVESSRLDSTVPCGDVTPWREVRFPLVAELRGRPLDELEALRVERLAQPGDEVEERYRCDANGIVEIDVANLTADYRTTFTFDGRDR